MDTSLSFLPVNPVSPSVADSTGSIPNTAQPAPGGEFSTLLTGQMLKAERQLFAAQALPGTGLQVLPLGNKIKLITSDGPLPDMASLAAFARTQGIDESAVQALFAGQNDSNLLASAGLGASPSFNVAPPASGTVTPLTVTPRGNSQSKELAAMMTADQLGQGNPLWQTTLDVTATAAVDVRAVAATGTLTPMVGSQNIAAWMPLKATAVTNASGVTNPDDVVLEAADPGIRNMTVGMPPNPAGVSLEAAAPRSLHITGGMPPKATTLIDASGAANPAGVSLEAAAPKSLNITGGIPPKATAVIDASGAANPAGVSLEAAAPRGVNMTGWMPLKATALVDASDATNPGEVNSETSIKDAMRLTMTSPAQAVTQRLAQMSGSSEQSTWAALLAGNRPSTGTPAAAKAWETLQLDVPDDLLLGPLNGSQDLPVDNSLASSTNQSAGHAAAGTPAGHSDAAVNAPPNLSSQAEQRVIQQQQLADKLGQALAQRLVDQIERGQWKIEMRLRPESLGRIEVELKMHAGGLDALFSAENAVTRELISQGSGKLKEALTHTGMTVADVSVSGDQNRQSGGNSTPGNSSRSTFGSAGRKPGSVEGVAAAVKDEPAATDGLNVWA